MKPGHSSASFKPAGRSRAAAGRKRGAKDTSSSRDTRGRPQARSAFLDALREDVAAPAAQSHSGRAWSPGAVLRGGGAGAEREERKGEEAGNDAAAAVGPRAIKPELTATATATSHFAFSNVLAVPEEALRGVYVPCLPGAHQPKRLRAADSELVRGVDRGETPLAFPPAEFVPTFLDPAKDLERLLIAMHAFDPDTSGHAATEHSLETSLPLAAYDNRLFEVFPDTERVLADALVWQRRRAAAAGGDAGQPPRRRPGYRSPPRARRTGAARRGHEVASRAEGKEGAGSREAKDGEAEAEEETKVVSSPPGLDGADGANGYAGEDAVRGVGLRPGAGRNGGPAWQRCDVLSATCEAGDPRALRFTVRWQRDGATGTGVPRVALCFDAEDMVTFARRHACAVHRRRQADTLLRYALYVDCMPTDDVAQLSADQLKRVLALATGSEPLLSAAPDAGALVDEANAEMARAMNRIVFDLHAARGEFRDVVAAAARGRTAPPQYGTVRIPPHEMVATFSEFAVATHLARTEVVAALEAVRRECLDLSRLAPYALSKPGPMELEAFREMQRTAQRTLEHKLADGWLAIIRRHVKSCLGGIGRPGTGGAGAGGVGVGGGDPDAHDFNLDHAEPQVYAHTKLARLLRELQYMMEDTLRGFCEAAMREYTAFVERACAATVAVHDTNRVDVTPGQDDEGNSVLPPAPLFKVSLIIHNRGDDPMVVVGDGEDDAGAEGKFGGEEGKDGGGGADDPPTEGVELLLSTEADAFSATLPRLFDTGLAAVRDVQTAEQVVMERLPSRQRETLRTPADDEPWVAALRERVCAAVDAASAPLMQYVGTFERYLDKLGMDVGAHIDELEAKHAENKFALVKACEKLIREQESELEDVRDNVPASMDLGLVRVDVSSVRNMLTAKTSKLATLARDVLVRTCAAIADEAMEEYVKILDRLRQPVGNVEELTEMNAYLDSIPSLLGNLEPQRRQVGDVYAVVDAFRQQVSFANFKLRWRVFGAPKEVADEVDTLRSRLETKRDTYMSAMQKDQDKFRSTVEALAREVTELKKHKSLDRVEQTAAAVARLKAKLAKADEDARLFNSREGLFDLEITEYDELNRVQKTFEPYKTLWEAVHTWQTQYRSWMEDPFLVLDAEALERTVEAAFRDLGKCVKTFKSTGMEDMAKIADATRDQVGQFRPHVPLIVALRNPGMKERHWEAISQHVGFEVMPDNAFTLTTVFELKLQDHVKSIAKVGESAGKEFQIEKALVKMSKEWEGVELEIEAYRDTGTYILKGVDELMALLDEHITMTQAMSFSAFKKPFEERIEVWNHKLAVTSEVIDEWIAVQRSWLYLQPIFDSADINRQLPKEGKMFKGVDKHWRSSLKQAKREPKALEFCANEELLDAFKQSNSTLDKVQKGLADYLETKRGAFSRFYFLSNDELLEILSQTKDPTRVQPHLKKCFEAIKSVTFEEDLKITVMRSGEGEEVKLQTPVDPNGVNVEFWMNALELSMKESVKYVMHQSIIDYTAVPRTDWIQRWPGMCVLNGSQTHWTLEMEDAMNTNGNAGLAAYLEQIKQQLSDMVQLVRGDVDKSTRTTIGALAVIDVHARDVTKKMVDDGVQDVNDFLWISQLRYYWEGEGLDGDLWTLMVSSKRPYGYEYLGNSFRLVITPLTDKCYLTLMGALQMVLGGAPAGPAGTGKTETTKDLAKALAKQCVVFNCSDGMDYKMTGKFFKGLASCGAWACFDEFNRITIEVLSVIAQQIMTLQRGVVEEKTRIMFEETEIRLSDQFAVFITMNPGYAGRTDLPDNLKALFRPVAMMVPDYALIGEIMLFSFGFDKARNCARKMVATFRLCSEQLSAQSHYDYGMRAVKTVIVAAGNLKRAEPHADEEVLLLRALMDVNKPKFLAHDLPLFRGIMSDLFPGKSKPDIDYGELLRCIKLCGQRRGLQSTPFFLEKSIELYEMIVVRHGLMVVGPTMGGKSSIIYTLQDALTMLKEAEVEGERYEKVHIHYLNPKSITMGQLYGEFDPNTHEWQDGVLANIIRVCAKDTEPDLKWVVFDGPVDTLWIESMNTVLDDNKKLCLNSGEIVALSAEMTMMFEPADLAVASPATVSRCGMVYMEPSTLGTDPMIASWLERVPAALEGQHLKELRVLFDTYVNPALTFLRRNLREPTPTVDNALVNSLLKLLDCQLACLHVQEGVEPLPDDAKKAVLSSLSAIFAFCLTWSVAATVDRNGRKRFDSFLRQEMLVNGHAQPPPAKGYIYDYAFDPTRGKWTQWLDTAEPYEHNSRLSFSEMIIPTLDTVRYTWLLDTLLLHGKHVLMTGETGTGKTVNINKHLQTGMSDKYVPLPFTFSAQTSANQTQDIIDGKTEKRRKGVFGPPAGKKFVIFVDDVNMPQREIFFAQPPIELLRQWMCAGGWYDRKTLQWRQIVDSVMVLACGPPGGGRNPVTPRFFRHFNTITYTAMQDESVFLIFNTILSNFLSTFEADAQVVCGDIVRATIDIYNTIVSELLPTPAKPHYTFNLRDVGKVFQGVLMCEAKQVTTANHVLRLWVHEAARVFRDRLINDEDAEWFDKKIVELLEKHTSKNWERDVRKADGAAAAKDPDAPLLYADFMVRGADPRVYAEVTDVSKLHPVMMEYLEDHNAQSKTPMNLVLFMDAMAHVGRIARVIRQPGGNALLLGVGGSGRQSLTKLATFMAEYQLFQVEIAKGYGPTEWRENIKTCLMEAGLKNKPVVFLFNDVQIVFEGMLEDINNILNTGDVPNLYAPEEMDQIMTTCRVDCQRKRIPPTKLNIFAQYLMRVQSNIHVVLCMSPMGDAFRRRMRMFPSLVNCCTIDWFHEWPDEALRSVADSLLGETDLGLGSAMEPCVEFFRIAHQSVARSSERYFETLRRHNYVTPTSFLELLSTYQSTLVAKRDEVGTLKQRLQNGLDKLGTTSEQVAKLQDEITAMQPELARTQVEVEEMMVQIKKDKEDAAVVQETVAKQETEATAKAAEAKAIKDDAQRDLDEALPALDNALKALRGLKKADLDEVKALGRPPAGVKLTMEATCIMFGVKPVKVADPDNPGKKINDYWDAAKKTILSNANKLLSDLVNFDKDNIADATITKILPYVENPLFTPAEIEKASKACTAICSWVHAMYKYNTIAKEVEPKREKLRAAEAELKETMEQLEAAKASLAEVEKKIATLEANFDKAQRDKKELVDKMDLCKGRLERAEVLIGGLGGEKARWEETVASLTTSYDNLVGDVLVSAGSIAYLGAFTPEFRRDLTVEWHESLTELKLPHSAGVTITSNLSDPVQVRQWVIYGLPTDTHSIENGIVMAKARRWPLLIDPQGQANRFIKNMGKELAENGMDTVKLSDKNLLRTLENGVRFGKWVLLENIEESLDAALEPLLLQQKFKQGGTEMIKIGDNTIPYNEAFKFYMTTKLPNPHYAPEVCVKVSLLNFTITEGGLEDQLLGTVVVKEMPELEQRKNELIKSNASMKKQLKDIEDKILFMLSNSKGNILDDVELIETLAASKKTSGEINAKVAEAEETEKEIDESREGYRPVAFRGSILYFAIADLATVDPMYQYSLQWFQSLFESSVDAAEPASETEKRIENLIDCFTYTLYTNVCRSLFERHKLLLSFLMAVKILQGNKAMDPVQWRFLISGQASAPAEEDNPAEEWLVDRAWTEMRTLSTVPGFDGLAASVREDVDAWKAYFDSSDTHRFALPGRWESTLKAFQKLCVLRCLRPDKMTEGIQDYVVGELGKRFVEPPPFNLRESFGSSSTTMPLIFVLSAGSDPTKMFAEFAEQQGFGSRYKSLSLGQGQDRIAEKMIESAIAKGNWVYLQNCHLYTSWLPKLEQIIEDIDPTTVHADFRLWLTSMPSKAFPTAVLQNGVKMTLEPPKGLRANLKNAYFKLDDAALNRTTKPTAYKKLLFALSFFHAIVQERRKFGPLGWNIPYEFNESDLDISRRQLELFLDKYEEVPYRVLNILTSYINYGGRVTDYIDLRTIDIILRELFCPDIMRDDYSFSASGKYFSTPFDERAPHASYMDYISSLPLNPEPEVFGMHDNANIISAQNETYELFDTILALQPRSSSGGGKSREEILDEVAGGIVEQIPEPYDTEAIALMYPLRYDESMNTVLLQECIRYNALIVVMRKTLPELRKALKGLVVMSGELESMADALFTQRVPEMFESKAYPSLKPLSSWVTELVDRIGFLQRWIDDGIPAVFWISGFFFPQAFLTGTLQNYARKHKLPIDTVSFGYSMKDELSKQLTERAEDGCYIDGIFLEGARWSKKEHSLVDSLPKQLYTDMPVIHLVPEQNRKPPKKGIYRCPVYKVLSRRGTLSTTGHSTNFVLWVEVPSNREDYENNLGLADQKDWVKAGVAAFCSLKF